MKKVLAFLLLGLLLTGCTVTETNEEVIPQTEIEQKEVETEETEARIEESAYSLVEKEFKSDKATVTYLQMEGYQGELTQDYINQSLKTIVDLVESDAYFESIEVKAMIQIASEDTLSVTYEGFGLRSGNVKKEILHPVVIDMKSSNEITYSNLINDDVAVRKLIEEKVIEDGIADYFEAEGIRVYMDAESVTFAYVPLDDSATGFIRVKLSREVVEPYLNTTFGEHPAS